jgi:UDPglucose--hexose-1-phosphate uridylyltransferase
VSVNEGRDAGASLPHSHSQLYALPFVPAQIARERERFTAYALRTHGRNLLGDLLQEEVRLRERTVAIDDEAVAICPYASRVPFELQIVPRTPRKSFAEDGALGARMVHDVLGRLERLLGAVPPLNLWVRTAPSGAEYFCWRIDLLPRLTKLAGLEMGTGVNLNIMPPERAAEQLRGA